MMIRISIEVGSDATRFGSWVRAEDTQSAVSIAEATYPGSDVRVRRHIDSDAFFVEVPAATVGPVGTGIESVAG